MLDTCSGDLWQILPLHRRLRLDGSLVGMKDVRMDVSVQDLSLEIGRLVSTPQSIDPSLDVPDLEALDQCLNQVKEH
jgi:hypothetical protein